MRCRSAQRHLTTGVEGLSPRRRAAAERHVAGCAACREELRATQALFAALDRPPGAVRVPPHVEEATLRAVRRLAAAERERPARAWGWWLPVPALAVAALAAVVVTSALERGGPEPGAPDRVAARPTPPPPAPGPVARAPQPPAARPADGRPPAAGTAVARRPVEPAPAEPPPELAERPDLFIDLPILRHMEKLEHYEQIRTTGAPDAPAHPANGEARTSG